MSVKLYGIPNCDSVKKAMTWLEANKISFEFHNYKTSGITKKKLKEWCKHFGWENVLNKKSTTWQGLTDDERSTINSEAAANNLMVEKTSSIKRPVLEADGKYLIRFNEEEYRKYLL